MLKGDVSFVSECWRISGPDCLKPGRVFSGHAAAIAFHPTFPQLVATLSNDLITAKLWDYETQECIATLKGHTNCMHGIAFHPTLPHLVSTAGGWDETAKVHDISKKISKQRHAFEQAYSAAHPLTVKTLAGETYTLEGWGSCKDLKAALCQVAGEQLGQPSSFELLADLGPHRVDAAALTAGATGGATGSSSQVQIDGKYGSIDRRKMVAPSIGFNFELTLVYTRA